MLDQEPEGNRRPGRIKRTPETEIVIGTRIRTLRMAAGMTQAALGNALGVTFQQIQKYEKGKDRVAVSTLQVLAAALGVHPGSFFDEEMPSPTGDLPTVRTALKDAAGFQRISNPKVRKRIAELIDALAEKFEPASEKAP